MSGLADIVIRVQVTVFDSEPLIWRRLEVPASFTLKRLHDAIQCAIGWYDGHLHEFEAGDVVYGQPDPEDGFAARPVVNETRIKLWTLIERNQRVLTYTYDFGDDWRCAVVLESALPAQPEVVYPRLVGGARAGPPDDVGGIAGYYRFLEILADPEHEEHAEMSDWIGGAFDPNTFDMDALNAGLARISPRKTTAPRKRAARRK